MVLLITLEINDDTTNGPSISGSDRFGYAITNMGDLNRDGTDDIAVSARNDSGGGDDRGAIHIMFMNTDGTGAVLSTAEINASTTNGPSLADYDYFGYSIANIGDLNRDGVDDLAVGAAFDDNGGTDRGAVHIMFLNTDGSVDSTVEINSSTTNGPTLSDSDWFGYGVANTGDLDNDGVDDLAVGAQGDDAGGDGRGTVHIMFMNTDGSVDSTVEINSSTTNGPSLADDDSFGVSVANMGDLNNDGDIDLVVGTHTDDNGGTDRGAVHIINLKSISTDGNGKVSSSVKIAHSTNGGPALDDGDRFGISVTRLGDIKDDGTYNIVVGADRDDTGGLDKGAIYILNMTATGTVSKITPIAEGTNGGPASLTVQDDFGNSVANIGDLNDDGIEDLAVSAYNDDTTNDNSGAVYILFMDTDGTVKSTPVKLANGVTGMPTLALNDGFGSYIEGIGDLNNDGIEDIAVHSYGDDTGVVDGGAIYILFMNTDGSVKTNPAFKKIADDTAGGPSLTTGDRFGRSIASIGDLNGDGIGDIAASARDDDTGGTDRGAVYILFMNTDGSVKTDPAIVKIASGTNGGPTLVDGGKFGSAIENIGDLNNDGVNDLAVGAFLDNDGGTGNGATYILFMKSDGTVDSSVKIGDSTNGGPSLAVNDVFGTDIANIGDLDNDGTDDLIVSAYLDDTGNAAGDRGAVYVMFMDETTIVTDVTSTETDGTFSTSGTTLDITATFSEAVTVSGTPQLTLETGTTDQITDYTSGTGTTTLTFQYTTQEGDVSSDLDYVSTSSLSGGVISDSTAAANGAVLTLPTPGELGSLSFNKALVISLSLATVATSVGSSDKSDSTQYQAEAAAAEPDESFSLPEEEYEEVVAESLATPISVAVEVPVEESFEAVSAPEKVEAAPEDTSFKVLTKVLSKSDDKEDDAKKLGLEYKDGDVRALVILDDNTPDTVINEIKKYANIESINSELVQINIPIDDLSTLYKIPNIAKVQPTSKAIQSSFYGEGYKTIHANIPHELGIKGDGIKIAILDLAFDDTNDEIKNNIVETKSFRHDFDGLKIPLEGFGTESVHGTAVSEIVIDVTPNSELYLYTFASEVEFLDAMDYAISQDVDLITMSAGWVNYPTDGNSEMTKKIESAISMGIPFVVSAGNYAQTHWEGNFIDTNENSWHEFEGLDEGISVVASQSRVDREIPFILYLMWDSPSGEIYDFDLSLTDEDGVEVAYSANLQETDNAIPFEYVYFTPEKAGTYSLGVRYGGDEPSDAILEIFSPSDKLEYQIAEGSVSVPTDARGIISVGAINYYDSRLEPFSSQGPTNNCVSSPTLVAPDAVTTTAYGNSPFFGTSAAAPHVAGMVALMIDKTPQLTPVQILSELTMYSDTDFDSYVNLQNMFGSGLADSQFIAELDEIVHVTDVADGCESGNYAGDFRDGDSDQQSKFAVGGLIVQQDVILDEPSEIIIPPWVKSNAGWWADGTVTDETFVNSLEFLIEQDIINMPKTANISEAPKDKTKHEFDVIKETIPIPDWIKNNAGWWSDGAISNETFIDSIEYLMKEKIIDVS
jgi:hypothetical protein